MGGAREVLCKQVGGVFRTFYFSELNGSRPDLVLEPEALSVNMPQLSQANPATDSNRGGGICPGSQGEVDSEVVEKTLVTQTTPCGPDRPIILCLA